MPNTNDEGTDTPQNQDDQTSENDIDLDSLDEPVAKKIQSLDAQRKSWRDKAVHEETGKTYKELYESNQADDKTSKNDKTDTKTDEEPSGFGDAQLALLVAKGIEHDDDIAFLEKVAERTGDDLRTLLSDDFVTGKLETMSKKRSTQDAMPDKSKRSGRGSDNEADYWAAKIESGESTIGDVPKEIRYQVIQKRANSASESSDMVNRMKQKQSSN